MARAEKTQAKRDLHLYPLLLNKGHYRIDNFFSIKISDWDCRDKNLWNNYQEDTQVGGKTCRCEVCRSGKHNGIDLWLAEMEVLWRETS